VLPMPKDEQHSLLRRFRSVRTLWPYPLRGVILGIILVAVIVLAQDLPSPSMVEGREPEFERSVEKYGHTISDQHGADCKPVSMAQLPTPNLRLVIFSCDDGFVLGIFKKSEKTGTWNGSQAVIADVDDETDI
jgi:hypothetical protein